MLCNMHDDLVASQTRNAIVEQNAPLFLALVSIPLAAGAHTCLQPMHTPQPL